MKMAGLVCECSDVMRASCEIDETDYAVLFMCAIIAWKLWSALSCDDESDGDAPDGMYS
jgi:hypothetical protein